MANYPLNRVSTGPYKPMNGLEVGFTKLSQYMQYFSAFLIILLVAIISIDVVLRSFFSTGIRGVMEMEIFLLVLIAFSAMTMNFLARRPIQIDLFYNTFKTKTQCRLDLFIYLVCGLLSFVMTYYTFETGGHHGSFSQVLAIPENIFIYFTSICYFTFGIAYVFLIIHIFKEMLAAKDFIGIVISITAAALLVFLPLIYREYGVRMSGLTIGAIGFAILMVLLLVRFPIGLAMAVIGILGSMAITRNPYAIFNNVGVYPYRFMSEFILVAMPTFMLMGEFIYHSGLSKDLFDCANKWLGRLPGGLASASVGGCAGFGAVCGDSMATVVTMTSVALPAMRENKYDPKLACGALAAGGTLGILIPPSMGFIFYSIITEQSIAQLFVAGIIPGILLTAIFIGIIAFQVIRNPSLAPAPTVKYTMAEKLMSLVRLIPIALIFILVVGGIMSGFFTPGEGGAVGAAGALVYSLLRRTMTKQKFADSLLATARLCGRIFVVMVGVNIFGTFLASSRLPSLLADFVVSMEVNRYVIIALVVLLYIILGCIMNIMPMMMLTLPSIFPTIVALGFDPIWFGVLCVLVMEMGMITPPVGMNVFTLASLAPDIPMGQMFKGIVPFFIGMLICVVLLILFPDIALFLPRMS